MTGVGLIGTLLIGALAGWIAEKLTGSSMGLVRNILLGIIGSYVGSSIASALHIELGEVFRGWFWGNLIISVAGAVLVIALYRLLRGKR